MRILFETLERDRFEIVDPCIPAGAETEKIIADSQGFDTVRILKFDPQTLQVWDMTTELFNEYQGDFDKTAPLWIQQHPNFEDRFRDANREAREWADHVRSFSHAA